MSLTLPFASELFCCYYCLRDSMAGVLLSFRAVRRHLCSYSSDREGGNRKNSWNLRAKVGKVQLYICKIDVMRLRTIVSF